MRQREKTDALFKLVKSLTDHEYKRVIEYARIFNADASQGHIQMFRYLAEMDEWDGQVFQDAFKNHPVARLKQHLHQFIFKALRVAGLQTHAELQELISEIDLAISKKSSFQARQKIKQAKTIAGERELFNDYLKILELERIWIETFSTGAETQKLLKRNWAEDRVKSSLSQNLKCILELKTEFYNPFKRILEQEGRLVKDFVSKVEENEILKNPGFAISARAKLEFNRIWNTYFTTLGKHEAGLNISLDTLELMRGNPWMSEEKREFYFDLVKRIASYHILQNDEKSASLFLKMLEEEYDGQTQTALILWEKLITVYCYYGIRFSNLDIGRKGLEMYREWVRLFRRETDEKDLIMPLFLCLRFAFDFDLSKEAKFFINEILELSEEAKRIPIQVFARILHMILLFKENDHIGLESHGRNYSRYIRKQGDQFNFGDLFVKFLRYSPQAIESGKFPWKLEQLETQLREIQDSPGALNFGLYFDLLKWVADQKNSL